MTSAASTEQSAPRSPRGQLAHAIRHIQDGYGLTLLLTILTVACLAATGVGTGGGVLAVVLTGATLLFALSTSQARPRVMRTAQILVAVAIAASALAIITGDAKAAEHRGRVDRLCHRGGRAGRHPAARSASSPTITYRLVIGALVVYLLLGLCYAYVFGLIGILSGEPFFVQTASPTTANVPVLQLHDAEHRRLRRLQRVARRSAR